MPKATTWLEHPMDALPPEYAPATITKPMVIPETWLLPAWNLEAAAFNTTMQSMKV